MASKQLLLTSFVKSISKEERELCLQRMSKRLRTKGATKKPEVPMKPKNLVGRLRKPNPPMTTTSMCTSSPIVEQSLRRSRSSRGSYIKWFIDDRWPQIAAAQVSEPLHNTSLFESCIQVFSSYFVFSSISY